MEYPDCFRIVEENVKPERTRKNDKNEFVLRKPLPQKWWIFADKRPALYSTIAGMKQVLVKSEVGSKLSFALVSNEWVFSHMLIVLALDSPGAMGLLQSTVHEVWARQYGSSMRTDLRYTPSDCFETFPLPTEVKKLDTLGEGYEGHRSQIMLARQEGLTKTYTRFHDPDEASADIQKLRDLHVEMDQAVAAA